MPWSSQVIYQLIIQGPNAGVFIYNGTPGSGNLIGSWAAQAGTDQYDNSYPQGINVNSGQLTGVLISSGTLMASTIINAIIQGPQITGGSYSGGVITSTEIIMSSAGGVILGYSTTTTTTTYSTPGSYQHTAIAAAANVSCWGSGAGAGGGNSTTGGETGGGGEWANEPSYPQVIGQQYPVIVPQGGTGGVTGQPGNNGSAASYNGFSGVYANGGQAGNDFLAGQGGQGSTNTNHNNGGDGANAGSSTGGSSGGNSGGPNGAGNNGIQATGTSGAASPSGQTGAGTGGPGGSNGNNGSNGGAPGAAGGGAGAGSSTNTFTKTYLATRSVAYYGTDVGGGKRNDSSSGNGTIYQGNPDAGDGNFPGNQFSFALFNYSQIQSDLSGATITDVKVRTTNLHSWYDSGMYVVLGYSNRTSFPSSISSLGGGDNNNQVQYWTSEGVTLNQDVEGYGIGSAFKSGAATCLMFGPATPSNSDPSLYDYGYFYGAGGSNADNVQLTISGTTGTGSNQAGSGANGEVQIIEQSTQTLVCAMSGVSGTDSSSNAYASGYTGNTQNFQPGSSPTAVETWHNVTPPSGWSGTCRYKKLAEYNFVVVDFDLTNSTGSGNVTIMTLPTGYIPAKQHDLPLAITTSQASLPPTLRVTVSTSGVVSTSALVANTTTIGATLYLPLD